MSTTKGYWLAEWRGNRPAVERSAASIGDDEIKLFYDCCQLLNPVRTYVIGNSFGLSTFTFALALPEQEVIAIDNWSEPGIGELTKSLSEAIIAAASLTNVRLVTGTSPQDTAKALNPSGPTARAPISIAFIDGLHRNHAAKADYDGLIPFLDNQSVVFWHNVNDVDDAFTSAYFQHGVNHFDRKLVLRTHGPLGVFFSSEAHPQLQSYLESCCLIWPEWQKGVSLYTFEAEEHERLERSRMRKLVRLISAPLG